MLARYRERAREWLKAGDLDLIGSLLLLALLVLSFLKLGDVVSAGPVSLDERILLALRDPSDPSVGIGGRSVLGAMRDLTALGSPVIVGMFSVTMLGWLLLTGRPGAALAVAIAVIGGAVLNESLKDVFARERPTIVPHLMGASDPSFPSGHAMIAAVLYPTIAELFGRLVRQRRLRFYSMSTAIVAAILVATSRVYLGVHHPSDAAAGLALGFAWALLCGIAVRLLQKHHVFRSRSRDRTDAEAEQIVAP